MQARRGRRGDETRAARQSFSRRERVNDGTDMRLIFSIAAAALIAAALPAAAKTSGAMTADGTRISVPMHEAHLTDKSDLILTTHEKHRIWRALHARRNETKPAGFNPHIGVDLPATVKLHAFPGKLAGEIAPIGDMRFAKLEGKLVVVRPSDRKIQEVIGAP
jgi:hypothetical protein